jgi:prepilin-type N-terminal cleavage/methylation domain-containing protein
MIRCPRVKGFTLIELLVVIAIIGTLSSIVLTALNGARNKGNDAAVRSNLANARAQGDLFYSSNGNSYVVNSGTATDVCNAAANASGTGTVKGVYTFVYAASQAAGIGSVTYNAVGTSANAVCNSVSAPQISNWAAQVPLRSGGFYCVDSNGIATTTPVSTLIASLDAVCGP